MPQLLVHWYFTGKVPISWTGMERYHGSMRRSSWLVQRSVRAIGQVSVC